MEGTVIGPLRGYYIATFACPMGDLGKDFISYYKVFPVLPANFGDSGHIISACTVRRYRSPASALHHAATLARREIEQLLPQRITQSASRTTF